MGNVNWERSFLRKWTPHVPYSLLHWSMSTFIHQFQCTGHGISNLLFYHPCKGLTASLHRQFTTTLKALLDVFLCQTSYLDTRVLFGNHFNKRKELGTSTLYLIIQLHQSLQSHCKSGPRESRDSAVPSHYNEDSYIYFCIRMLNILYLRLLVKILDSKQCFESKQRERLHTYPWID